MYDRDQPLIEAAMRASVSGFKRGVMFAVCSMRQPVTRVPMQLDALDNGDARDMETILFGHKKSAFKYLEENATLMWGRCCNAPDAATVILTLTDMPGMGIVKAGFIAQMLGHDVACLDSRNIQRRRLKPRRFATNGVKHGAAHLRKVGRYIRETRGRSREHWNAWCDYVAPDYGMTGEAVSALHVCIAKPSGVSLEDTF